MCGTIPRNRPFIDNITFHPVPEPSTLAMLGLSLAAHGIARRRIV